MKHATLALSLLAAAACFGGAQAQGIDDTPAVAEPPSAQDWADLAKLPDWGGIWLPDIHDQFRKMDAEIPPWTPSAAAQIAEMRRNMEAGKPKGLFVNCLPEAMPSWMLITHNALEFLFTPGRVTILGEVDSNRLRRIYTDGRGHPEDPDLTFHGHSIGRWDGEALIIDTVGVLPETYIAIGEAMGVPNNGDMRISERIYLTGPDSLVVDIEIDAPHVLMKPWKTQRLFTRKRGPGFDIIEGSCLQGMYYSGKDENGNSIFVLSKDQEDGIPMHPDAD